MNREVFVFALIILTCSCARLPSTWKKCNRKQTDFNKCFHEAARIASRHLTSPIKELGLPSVDPFEVPAISIGTGTGPAAFTQDYSNVKLFGFGNLSCSKTEMNLQEKTISAQCTPEEIKMIFDYEFKGRVLVLPIYGKGAGSVTITKPTTELVFYLDEYEKKGKRYYKVIKADFKVKPYKLAFQFDNIFGTDKSLNENINEVFNDNWEALYEDVGHNYEEAFARIFTSFVNNFFARVPINELFADNDEM